MQCRHFAAIIWALLSVALAPAHAGAPVPHTLREAAGDAVLIGCSIGTRDVDAPKVAAVVAREFNCLTADNQMMPAQVVDDSGHYTFAAGDKIQGFAAEHGMTFFGHMLVWQHETRDWFFSDKDGRPLPREQALQNLRAYITAVVGHYRGKVKAWAVVNEALSDAPGEFLRDTPARRAIGDDFIEKAFAYAHAADADVELYYNDYNIEEPEKRAKALRLIKSLQHDGVRIDAIGIQGHWLLNYPAPSTIADAIQEFRATGLKVMITELDIDVLPRTTSGADLVSVEQGPNPYAQGLPTDMQHQLATRYGDLFDTLLRSGVTMITFWGPHDGRSWLNDFPVKHRTNYPLLFDRAAEPKPAYHVVLERLARWHESRSASGIK